MLLSRSKRTARELLVPTAQKLRCFLGMMCLLLAKDSGSVRAADEGILMAWVKSARSEHSASCFALQQQSGTAADCYQNEQCPMLPPRQLYLGSTVKVRPTRARKIPDAQEGLSWHTLPKGATVGSPLTGSAPYINRTRLPEGFQGTRNHFRNLSSTPT